MRTRLTRRPVVGASLALTLTGLVAACASPARSSSTTPAPARASARPMSPAEVARADSGRPPFTAADVRFMSGMIGHHAQAVMMASWAASHGASPAVRTLSGRIDVSQRDEIAFMQRWLRERRQPVPDADASHDMMPGMKHGADHMMPGMLTAEELIQLDKARGTEFDRLFLTFMIRHHEGAITMVEALFGSPGAGQDDAVFKFASDVNADQSTEIARMTLMLTQLR